MEEVVLIYPAACYSTVTDLARLRGQSTLHPRLTAMWYDRSCMGITVRIPCQDHQSDTIRLIRW